MNAIAVVDEVVSEVFTPSKRKNPFGITAAPGSKTYHRQYTKAWVRQRRAQREIESKQIARAIAEPRMGSHITLSELSKSQGWPLDKKSIASLRNRLQARQKLVGVVLLFKLSPRPMGRYYTTLPLLRRYASELFDEAGEQASVVKALLAGVQQTQAELRAAVKQLQRRIRALEDRPANQSGDPGSALERRPVRTHRPNQPR
jgi:hypothetical protein